MGESEREIGAPIKSHKVLLLIEVKAHKNPFNTYGLMDTNTETKR